MYGHSGPAYGSYEVRLDSAATTLSAYAANNASTPQVIYKADNLTYGHHTITFRNLGAQNGDAGGNTFLFDSLQQTIQLAPAGYVSPLLFLSNATDSSLYSVLLS